MPGPDEFETIARLLRPLAGPEGLSLLDDAAVLPPRPGFDLVVTTDTIVEGVHFLADTPLDLLARKLLRVNLSDLAAKGAEPYGYLLNCAWPERFDWDARDAFARGLADDQARFGLKLFGGDTTGTSGPLTISATLFGWVPAGGMVKRSGARAGDLLQVSGPIGDGLLGLKAARGELDLPAAECDVLIWHYETPMPRLDISLAGASAAADVSDGLIADAGHIGEASGLAIEIELDRVPVSRAGEDWLSLQADRAEGLAKLAAGGDDYEIVAAAPGALSGFTVIGRVTEGEGVRVLYEGREMQVARTGWRHGNSG